MKTNIKTTIGIIVIALSSISFAQAGEHRSKRSHDRSADRSHNQSYDNSRQQRHYRHGEGRQHWKRSRHNRSHSRAQRNHRSQRHSYGHQYRRHNRYNEHYRGYRRHGYQRSTYTPEYGAPSHGVVVTSSGHNDAVPVIVGGLIGSSIANDASNGDPVATFGGAVVGAIIGNAIAHH